ncbi:unnamed protein product [Amoebophrya sp. A120]|nr:unnamed protein product [Amoebophrya sp. A120]|eukprot:GSA120T00015278001.1
MGGGKGFGLSARGPRPSESKEHEDDDASTPSEVCSHHPEFDDLENFVEEVSDSSGASEADCGEGSGPCKDLFSDAWFDNAPLCVAHMQKAHGFSFAAVREAHGEESWTMYSHFRLVGYLRRLGAEQARELIREPQHFGPENPFWNNDEYLIPAGGDATDPLLFAGEEFLESDPESATKNEVVQPDERPRRRALDPELVAVLQKEEHSEACPSEAIG